MYLENYLSPTNFIWYVKSFYHYRKSVSSPVKKGVSFIYEHIFCPPKIIVMIIFQNTRNQMNIKTFWNGQLNSFTFKFKQLQNFRLDFLGVFDVLILQYSLHLQTYDSPSIHVFQIVETWLTNFKNQNIQYEEVE